MEYLQVQDYMIVALVENTKKHYEEISISNEEDYVLYQQLIFFDDAFIDFLSNLGIDPIKPVSLQSYEVDQGTANMFTGKFYFEGYLEMGELDAWDIVCGDTVLSFTNDEQAPFQGPITSYVEISFEMIKRVD